MAKISGGSGRGEAKVPGREGVGWDLDSDEFANRWDGDIGEFMSASNWRDLGG